MEFSFFQENGYFGVVCGKFGAKSGKTGIYLQDLESTDKLGIIYLVSHLKMVILGENVENSVEKVENQERFCNIWNLPENPG